MGNLGLWEFWDVEGPGKVEMWAVRERVGMGGGQDKGDDVHPTDQSSASEKVQGAGRPCPAKGNAGQVKQLERREFGEKDKSWLKVLL